MKLKYLAIALVPFLFTACQSTNLEKVSDIASNIVKKPNTEKLLSSYYWSATTDKSIKPLVLTFNSSKSIHIQTSCNGLFGGYSIENQHLMTPRLAMTLIGCSGAPQKQEQFAGELFGQEKIPFTLNADNVDQPILTLTAPSGEKIVFTGRMTPETKYKTQGETIFLEISPETKSCTGVAPQTCLQVREIKYSEEGLKKQVDKDWTLFYDQIEGFEHTPNERQIIRLKRYEIKNPAADQSKYAYIYDMAVEREAVKGSL